MTRAVISMTIEDAEHYSPEQRAEIISTYPEHERDARIRGIPSFGSGAVFAVADERIVVDDMPIPAHWPRINGLDFGWDHPFAAIQMVWDRDGDCLYVTREYREREATPLVHAAVIKAWGDWVPCAWPHDGLQHDKGSGQALRDQYVAQGLHMLPGRATFEDGKSFGIEAGVMEMLDRMRTERFKVFRSCGQWMSEKRLYHRKEGLIAKVRDDLISASRYAMMMRRDASIAPRARRERNFIKNWMG